MQFKKQQLPITEPLFFIIHGWIGIFSLLTFSRIAGINAVDIVTMAVPPGLRADQMGDSLERLFTKVVPRLKAELA